MRTWLVNVWDTFRTGFWFFPTLLIVAAICLAIVVPEIDRQMADALPDWVKSSGSSARSTLAALASALFTVAGVVFSVTVVTLSLTSSQFGPRLLRNFLEQSFTQITIGSCLAASIYCLLLLRQVDDLNDEWFVPHLAVFLATLLTLVTICLVVYFIHRVAYSIQSMNVVHEVATDLDRSIERMFPEKDEVDRTTYCRKRENLERRFAEHPGSRVLARGEGYLQAINVEQLSRLAKEHQLYIHLTCRPGDFVVKSHQVARYLAEAEDDEKFADKIAAAYLFGNQRTPRQDVECALSELTEIAVRALSPGINDPFTAVASVDRLSAAICRLAERDLSFAPLLDVDEDQQLRLLGPTTSLGSVLKAAFDQIRQNATRSVAVSIRLLEALARIAEQVKRPDDRKAIVQQADMILEGCNNRGLCEGDLDDLQQRHHTVLTRCGLGERSPVVARNGQHTHKLGLSSEIDS